LAPHLLPAHVKTRQHFLDEFCVVQMKTFGPVVVGGRNLGQLSSILKCCSSRLRLEDVTTLPPLTVATLPVEVTAADRRAMDAALTDEQLREIRIILTEIEGGSEAAWQRLQAMLLPLASMRRVTALAKAPGCVEAIRAELDGGADRIVVFGSHIDALKYVHKYSRDTRLIIGDTTQVQRDMALAAFEQGIARVLVCNTSVGGFGLNLQHSARCFMLDLPWTPAGLDQAVARLHRAGQRRHVHVSLLAVARSIDERVATILQRKRRLITEIVEGTTP
jgi:SNF2 family DNA or RNA helicase